MQMETKFLRLRTPVELGSRFGDWQVCWLGGWVRFRLHFLVMVVKVPLPSGPVVAGIQLANRRIDLAFGAGRAMNSVAMNTFTIERGSLREGNRSLAVGVDSSTRRPRSAQTGTDPGLLSFRFSLWPESALRVGTRREFQTNPVFGPYGGAPVHAALSAMAAECA